MLKHLTILLVILCCAELSLPAQTLLSGTIQYNMERQAQFNINGKQLSQKMQSQDQLDFKEGYYRLTSTLLPGGGQGGPGISFNGTVPAMKAYYVPSKNAIFQHLQANGKSYGLQHSKSELTSVTATGKTDSLLGYRIEEFTCQYNGEAASGWYCTALPAILSPFGNLGLPGALLRFSSPGAVVVAVHIAPNPGLATKDLQLPADARFVTKEEFLQEQQ